MTVWTTFLAISLVSFLKVRYKRMQRDHKAVTILPFAIMDRAVRYPPVRTGTRKSGYTRLIIVSKGYGSPEKIATAVWAE
jgi:hypothetical protein